jgi:alginate O-acetyltransferase complex protein AlgI
VWGLTGLWHGAEWNFILWGLYYGIILLAEKTFLLKIFEKLPCAVKYIYTLFLTVIGFTIFNANGINGIAESLTAMFGAQGLQLYNEEVGYYFISYLPVVIIAMILSTPLMMKLYEFISKTEAGDTAICILKPIYYIAILLICTASLIDGSFNPFIYFRF